MKKTIIIIAALILLGIGATYLAWPESTPEIVGGSVGAQVGADVKE